MSNLLILTAGCLGLLAGYVLGCERVHALRLQRNLAETERDQLAADLVLARTGQKVVPIRTGRLR